MNKSKQKTLKKERLDQEARKEVAIQRSKEDLCRAGLLEHFDGILTVAETQHLMEDLDKIEVKSLWEDRWRVNVWTKKEVEGSFMYEHGIKVSFFIVWSDEFGVTYCNPPIKKAIYNNFKVKEFNV
jgi:hypothetical protein